MFSSCADLSKQVFFFSCAENSFRTPAQLAVASTEGEDVLASSLEGAPKEHNVTIYIKYLLYKNCTADLLERGLK